MQYIASVNWKNTQSTFDPKTYDRTHAIKLDSGLSFDASSAPEYLGNKALPNPEELFTASIASCFLLTFLYIAAIKKFTITECEIKAIGSLGKNSEGKMCVTTVALEPRISFSDKTPDETQLKDMLHKAHEQCFISSSVKSEITIKEEAVITS